MTPDTWITDRPPMVEEVGDEAVCIVKWKTCAPAIHTGRFVRSNWDPSDRWCRIPPFTPPAPEIEPKLCPICGKSASVIQRLGEWWEVNCSDPVTYWHRLTRGATREEAVKRWNRGISSPAPSSESVVVSIKALRILFGLMGNAGSVARDYLDEIIETAVPLAKEKVCQWTWDERGFWRTLCAGAWPFGYAHRNPHGFTYCPHCSERIEVVK